MTDVTLRREDDRRVVFANRPFNAFLVGLAFAVAGYAVFLAVPDRRRWFLLAVVVTAVVISIAAMLRRQRLVLDLAGQRYVRESGYWPRPESVAGPLEEIEHVLLSIRMRSRGLLPMSRRQQRFWVVSVKFRGDDAPYDVLEERHERKAYARFESLARRLRVAAVDRTRPQEQVTPWEQAGAPLALRLGGSADAVPAAVPAPPGGSGIRFHDAPGRRRIVLPPHGFAPWVPVLFVLPAALVTLGAALLWVSFTLASGAGAVLGALLLLGGLVFAFLFAASLFGNEWIAEEREELVFGRELFGLTWYRQRAHKRDVREIEIVPVAYAASGAGGSAGAAPPQEVMVRSRALVRRFGAHLGREERAWLRAALMAMAQ